MWTNPAYNRAADRRQKQIILDLLPVVRGQRVLDLGCGTGRLSLFLSARGAKVTGIDFSYEMLVRAEAAARAAGHDVDFRHTSLDDFALTPERFDVVLSVGCLAMGGETRAGFDAQIAHVATLTRPGGHILLLEPIHRYRPFRRGCPFPASAWIEAFRDQGCHLRHRERALATPVKILCGFAPVPAILVRPIFDLGEGLTRLPGLRVLLADYTVLLFQRT